MPLNCHNKLASIQWKEKFDFNKFPKQRLTAPGTLLNRNHKHYLWNYIKPSPHSFLFNLNSVLRAGSSSWMFGSSCDQLQSGCNLWWCNLLLFGALHHNLFWRIWWRNVLWSGEYISTWVFEFPGCESFLLFQLLFFTFLDQLCCGRSYLFC